MIRNMTLLATAAALAACSTSGTAPGGAARVAPRAATLAAPAPKLTVVISVDQFSSDLFEAYRPYYTGGLKRLAGGLTFVNGLQAHAATETCPGHSTQLTGARPARTGIIANSWVDQAATRADKDIYCAEDERAPGTDSRKYQVSAVHLKVPTLGDLIEQADPARQTVAVAGKDRAAVMMGGHQPDQRWYWDGKRFATDLADRPVPRAVGAASAAVAALLAAPDPGLTPPPLCQQRARPVAVPGRPAPLGAGTLARAAGDGRGFVASPAYDGAVLALAAGLVEELGLGADSKGDLLTLGLSATDYVGHAYGPGGQEMCLQMLALDRELGDFLALLDAKVGDYAVVLTADHGGSDIPERLRDAGVPGAHRVSTTLTLEALNAAVGGPVEAFLGDVPGDLYLNTALASAERARAMAAGKAWLEAQGDVEAVLTKAELAAMPMPGGDPMRWSLAERARASFETARSGDLVVLYKEHVNPIGTPGPGYVATHGSPYGYDRRVPILFWRPGMVPQERAGTIETIDIAPTLAPWFGVRFGPAAIDGQCRSDVVATC